jgi:quercetin dioxygenase-like cupin family protein
MADQPDVSVACVSNVYIRMMTFKKTGDEEQGHCHPFDHASLLSTGALRVEVEGEVKDFTAPAVILIKADAHHQLTALQDNTVVSCVHALRTGERIEDILPPDAVISRKERRQMVRDVVFIEERA